MGKKAIDNQELEGQVEHPALQQGRIVRQEGQTLIKVPVCLDRKQYDRWLEELTHFEESDSLFLPLSFCFRSSSLCGGAGTAQILFPNYPMLLQEEIRRRAVRSSYFSEQQLWYLLLSAVTAKHQAMKAGEMLGDVRPRNLLLNSQGRVRLPILQSWPLQPTKYQKVIGAVPVYLAPEEVAGYEASCLQYLTLNEPAEMFAIGLTVLSAANLRDYECLYLTENPSLDQHGLEQATQQLLLNTRYSEVLRGCIANLVSWEPAQRMALRELWLLLEPHSKKINAKENFVIYNAPGKLHEQVGALRTSLGLKTAHYPSSLPDRTSQAIMSDCEPSQLEKLVPSHLNENTLSAVDLD